MLEQMHTSLAISTSNDEEQCFIRLSTLHVSNESVYSIRIHQLVNKVVLYVFVTEVAHSMPNVKVDNKLCPVAAHSERIKV